MKGDITRSTWDPRKHYSSVRMQQGRVQVDADWNEQADIAEYLRESAVRDVIGPCGVPMEGDGFAIGLANSGEDLSFTAGRIYVDGILCEAEEPLLYSQQPSFPEAPLPPDLGLPPILLDGPYLVYLDVWRRHVTALEDPQIRETALGGPDTATRTQVVAQIKLLRSLFDDGVPPNCSQQEPEGWTDLIAPSSGRLRARTRPGATATNPCIVPAQAGYTRLENQLYRVEVHDGGALGAATFKWSRNNGTVVSEWLSQNGNELTVTSTGPDKLTGFHDAQWVELTDDTRELQGRPGLLVRVSRVDGQVIEIDPEGQTVDRGDFPRNPKIRRWDLPDTASGAVTIATPGDNDGYLPLENGIEVRFEAGEYRVGDYWTIPARAFVGEFAGEIEWPQEGPNQGVARAPEGIEHHYCKLGFVAFDGTVFTTIFTDCRPKFPPLTKLRRFYAAGGDGQQAPPGAFLPCPLRVAVTRGELPVAGARVLFEVASGDGRLELPNGSLSRIAIVETDASGIAECRWEMPQQVPTPGTRPCLRANAILLEDGLSSQLPPLAFSAQLLEVGGTEPGIVVESVMVTDSSVSLLNDGPLPSMGLAQGLMIQCDREIDPAAFFKPQTGFVEPAKPNCVVTLDLPYPIGSDNNVWDIQQVIGFQPLVLRANVVAEGNRIFWQPHPATADWIRQVLFNRSLPPQGGGFQRFLCRLTLAGNFIWGAGVDIGGIPELYLDGETFGAPEAGRVDARFPSGNGRRGGDFEMWFWLEQGELIAAPRGLTVDAGADGGDIFVTVLDDGGARVPGVGVTLAASTAIVQSGVTNTAGSVVFRGVPNGTYSVRASIGGVSGSRPVTVTAGGRFALQDLTGVGEVFRDRLVRAGFGSAQEIAELKPEGLADILQTSPTRAEKILAEAQTKVTTKSKSKQPKSKQPKPKQPTKGKKK